MIYVTRLLIALGILSLALSPSSLSLILIAPLIAVLISDFVFSSPLLPRGDLLPVWRNVACILAAMTTLAVLGAHSQECSILCGILVLIASIGNWIFALVSIFTIAAKYLNKMRLQETDE
jgi:hypothetical protein